MSVFLRQAEEIFQTARQGGRDDGELAIVVGYDGGIRMFSGREWALEPLRLHHGARAAYRVTRSAGRVRLEARSAEESCVLESPAPQGLGRSPQAIPSVLPEFPRYLLIS